MTHSNLTALNPCLFAFLQRFGSGYQLSVSVMPPKQSATDITRIPERAKHVKEFFKVRGGLKFFFVVFLGGGGGGN
jgi:hypothetical protein